MKHDPLTEIPETLRYPPVPPEPALTDEERERLHHIAEIRADGNSWEQTAKLLKADAKELRQFVKKAGVAFRRMMARADRELTRDSRREAMFVLRKQLRSDPDSIGARLAAQCLANIDLTYYRHRNKKPKLLGLDPNSPELQEALRFVNFKNSLKPGEAELINRNIIETKVRSRLEQLGLDPSKFDRPPDEPPTGCNLVPRDPKPPTQPEASGQKPESEERSESPRESERLDILSPRDEGPSYKPVAFGEHPKEDAVRDPVSRLHSRGPRGNVSRVVSQTSRVPAMRRLLPLIAFGFLATLLLRPAFAADDYTYGPDSIRHDGVPKGKVTQFKWDKSKVFEGTVRDCWVYVPAQYDGKTPACVMVFQDGGNYVNEKGQFRVPIVFDNLIHKKEMPVTIGIFINPGVFPKQERQGPRALEPQLRVRHAVGPVCDVPGEGNPAGGREDRETADRRGRPRDRRHQFRRHLRLHRRVGAAGPVLARCCRTSAASRTSAAATSIPA